MPTLICDYNDHYQLVLLTLVLLTFVLSAAAMQAMYARTKYGSGAVDIDSTIAKRHNC